MSRLFNSKWAIAALVCIAIYVVASNTVLPLMAKQQTSEEVPFMEDIQTVTNAMADIKPLKSVKTSMLFWNDAPRRDPFGPKVVIEIDEIAEVEKIRDQREKTAQKITPAKPAKKNRYRPVPTMSGFVSGAESRYAVLNDQIIAEGQSIDSYLVMAVTQSGVRLRHPNGSSVIKLTVRP